MTRDQVVALAEQLGFHEVKTAMGWIKLTSWNPYDGFSKARFTFDAKQEAIIDDVPPGESAGVWRIRK